MVAALFADVRARVPEVEEAVLSFHGQDDLGLATANSLAAIGAGARQLEVAVNGIGERAGNTSFEEVVAALHVHGARLDVETRVDPSGICSLSREVERRSGIGVPPNKAVVGRNAFRHASGIHQDGVLKHRETYEVLDPAVIGHPTGTEIVLGKLSGRTGFAQRIAALGFELDEPALERAFPPLPTRGRRAPRGGRRRAARGARLGGSVSADTPPLIARLAERGPGQRARAQPSTASIRCGPGSASARRKAATKPSQSSTLTPGTPKPFAAETQSMLGRPSSVRPIACGPGSAMPARASSAWRMR